MLDERRGGRDRWGGRVWGGRVRGAWVLGGRLCGGLVVRPASCFARDRARAIWHWMVLQNVGLGGAVVGLGAQLHIIKRVYP